MAKVLSTVADPERGIVRVTASGVPDGPVVVTRQAQGIPVPIRGGSVTVSTGGLVMEDAEPPFGQDLIYKILSYPTTRQIQTNRVLNPRFANDTGSWTGGTGRTLTRVVDPAPAIPRDATTALQIGPNTAGASVGDIASRTLASTAPDGLAEGTWWVTGQVMYDSPDLWLWDDVKAAGTWQDVKNIGTWQTVKTHSSVMANQAFATLWCAVLSPTNTVVVAPFQILGVTSSANNNWLTFSGAVTVPTGAPAGSRLVFLHGTVTREYACTFWLTTILVSPLTEMTAGALTYFDGDSVLPANPAANLVPGWDWSTVSADASMTWTGTPNASSSVFTGPSTIAATDTNRIDSPPPTVLPRNKLPIFLSDPILPQISVWFELIEIGDLTYAARQQLYDVIDRGAQIAVGSARAWATGQLRLLTYDLETASVAERMFAPGRILFLRNPDTRFPESNWYVAIGDVVSGRVGTAVASSPERLWQVPFIRVERPEGLIAATTSTSWGDIKAAFTWDELRQQRTDWLDVAVEPV